MTLRYRLGLIMAAVAVGVAVGLPAQAAPAEGAIMYAQDVNAVDDSYIVVLRQTAVTGAGLAATAAELADRYSGRLGHIYTNAIRGFEVSLPQAAARRLAAHPMVEYVQRNRTVAMAGTQSPTPSWGLDRIDQHYLPLNNTYNYPNTGSGVKAYIIDTGIRFTHRDFGGRAVTGFDAIDGGPADDCNGHGTHVAGTVGGTAFGVAKTITLVAVRVLSCAGSGTYAQVISGIDWVTGNHTPGQLAVANLSLGGGFDQALNSAVTNSIADGIVYAVAAGGSNSDACGFSPGSTPNAITVGGTTPTDARAPSSNYGVCLDLFAPGTSITSAWYTSDTATATISGTSTAAPHVAGGAAMVLTANPSFTPQQVRDKLVASATPNVVTNPGPGSPNLLLYVGTAS